MAQPVVSLKVCPYSITSDSSLNAKETDARKGWLLRCEFSSKLVGYADFHPLPLLKSSESLLREALQGKPGPQFQQSINMAFLDATAREINLSLFAGLKAPLSHALVQDVTRLTVMDLENLSGEGFKYLKLKLGRDRDSEQSALIELKPAISKFDFKLRLDFNSSNSPATWTLWEGWLKDHFSGRIDFIEDPLPWDNKIWPSSQLPLALDLEWDQAQTNDLGFLNRIIWKPALGLGYSEKYSSRTVVTHIMDHPIGHLGAVYWALKNGIRSVGGYLSRGQKDSLGFSEDVQSRGPQLIFPRGTGWGFDERLHALEWQIF